MRIFTGLPLPGSAAGLLDDWMESWRSDFPDLHVVKAANLHITVYFFGEKRQEEVEDIKNSLGRLQPDPVNILLGGVGRFPPRGIPRVFYLGIDRGKDEVLAVYRSFMDIITPLGYLEERKEFIPHITFARSKKHSSNVLLPPSPDCRGLSLKLDRFILYESRLGPSGPDYIPIKTVLFKMEKNK
jgi:2'-5' RNA ligase